MLVALEADKPSETLMRQPLAHGGDQRRGAQHQPDDHRRFAMRAQEPRQFPGLVLAAHHRLFGKDPHTRFKPRLDVIEMQMIGRADHQQIGLHRRQHRRDAFMRRTRFDPPFLERAKPHRRRIAIAGDAHMRRGCNQMPGHGRNPLPEPGNGNGQCLCGSHFLSGRVAGRGESRGWKWPRAISNIMSTAFIQVTTRPWGVRGVSRERTKRSDGPFRASNARSEAQGSQTGEVRLGRGKRGTSAHNRNTYIAVSEVPAVPHDRLHSLQSSDHRP
mgnify:CR=1 FL=1